MFLFGGGGKMYAEKEKTLRTKQKQMQVYGK